LEGKSQYKAVVHWLFGFIKALYLENPFLWVTQYENSSLLKMEFVSRNVFIKPGRSFSS